MHQIDTASKHGEKWFKQWIINRLLMFTFGTWMGLVIGLLPFWELVDPVRSYGRFAYAFWWSIPIGIFCGYFYLLGSLAKKSVDEEKQREIEAQENAKTPEQIEQENINELARLKTTFEGLFLGVSTGFLADRGHIGGRPNGEYIQLSPEDCSKNLIIFGGIGGGKTSRSINPLLLQLLRQNTGAMIFDIKTDFQKDVAALTKMAGRDYQVVGDGGMTLNLFRGCTPELASSYLKSCFLAQGQGTGDSAFWVDSATEMARHCLNLLNLLRPEEYSIAGLYDVVFDHKYRESLLTEGADNISTMTDREQRFFVQSQRFFVNVWNEHDEKLRKNIMGTMNAVLSPFAHPDLVDAFSTGSTHGEADITKLINDGAIYLVNLPVTKYGKEGAKFAYMLIKLRFMNMMKERRMMTDWNQDRRIAFVCDEYQAIIDSISDTDFWDKSRSAGCIGIVSMQGVSSLILALGGNKDTAHAVLQNFRQRIIYRTEDQATLDHVKSLLGQIDVHITSTGGSTSESDSWATAGIGGQQPTHSVSQSESVNTSIQRNDLFGSNDMRSLSADFCLLIGNLGAHSCDEVLQVEPLYLN
jgi:hypothetical protein